MFHCRMLLLVILITMVSTITSLLELPDPRIVIVGPTGAGKSSLANALLGCDPRTPECMFEVCGDLDSCTKETTIGTGPWLGTEQNFTVVDTPGFGDSSGEDNKLIEEMMLVLDGSVGYTNTIMLLFDGQTARFTSGLQNMLRQMSAIFGAAWWDYMIVGVSKWSYSQEAIKKRQADCDYYGDPSDNCKNEAWFMREINGQLQEKFLVEKNFTFAFIDSFSQSGPALEDSVQQDHYQAETKILWDSATSTNSTFDFMTIDDVLEENAVLKEENERLHGIIETNITTLFLLVHNNEDKIETNENKIDHNNGVIDHNTDTIASIDTRLALNEANLLKANDAIGLNVLKLEELDFRIGSLTTEVAEMQTMPLGTIIAWVNKITANGDAVDLLPGWQRCDGSTILHPSIWAGKMTPDINHEKRFLRGGPDSDMLSVEEDTTRMEDHSHVDNGHGHSASSSASDHSHVYMDCFRDLSQSGDGLFGGSYWHLETECTGRKTDSAKVMVTTTVNNHSSGLGGVQNLKGFGQETRPKNMNVVYIMRVW